MQDDIDIIVPTLNATLGRRTGNLAVKTGGVGSARLIVSHDKDRERFTKTVNRGLKRRRHGAHVCILNDDVSKFQLGWLLILLTRLKVTNAAGVCPSGKSHTSPMRQASFVGIGEQKVKSIPFWCILISNKALRDIGLLDEQFVHYASDNDWCKRALKRGYNLIWIKSVYLWHEAHGSGRFTDLARSDHKKFRRKW